MRGETRYARRQLGGNACLNMFRADLLEAVPIRAAENAVDFSLELTDTLAELRHGRIDLQLALAMGQQPVRNVPQQPAGLERHRVLKFGRDARVERFDLGPGLAHVE